MKKLVLLLLLITITPFTNVSYASFPVTENTQTKVVETIEVQNYKNSPPILGILSLILSLVGLILVFTSTTIGTGLLLLLFAIIFGIVGLFKKRSRMLSIASILLSLISILVGLMIISIMAFGVVGSAFGG